MSWAGFRQWRQHKAFRIAAPSLSGAEYDELDACLAELGSAVAEDPADDALAEAATNLWRARRKLAQGKESQGRQAARYLRTCADALAAAGLTVQDHDGEPFRAGRSVDVLLYSDDPAATEETVVETVRPAVYHRDRQLQTAQVIVAVPPHSTKNSEDSHA
ncbi:hypothetical protein ACXJJ3_14175 [Kribbella sp. WER1]